MYFFFKFILMTTVLLTLFKDSVSLSTKEYIELKLNETKELLTKTYIQARASVADEENTIYNGKWIKLWNQTWMINQPRLVTFFDQIFIIDGENILSINLNSIAIYNTHIVKLNFPSTEEPVKFIKSIYWSESLFLLICQIRFCILYKGSDISNLENHQIIEYIDLLPVDACFFTRRNQLYLIISYKTINYLTNTFVPSKIYQWIETNMNYIEEVLTPATIAVAAIRHKLSTIVLFVLEHNEIHELDIKISCLLYKLQDKSSAKSITFLTSKSPIRSIFSYNYKEEEFIFLTGDESLTGTFWWDGITLRRWIKMPDLKSSSLIKVVNVINETLLFACNSDVLLIYKISNDGYTYLNELNLEYKHHVVEIAIWEKDKSVMLMLINQNANNTYLVELWQLHLKQKTPENLQFNNAWTCFKELQDMLDLRSNIIGDFKSIWLNSLPILENNTTDNPIQISKLYYADEEDVPFVKFNNEEEYEISTPLEISKELKKVKKQVDTISAKIKSINTDNKITSLSGKIIISGDANFEEFHIDNLNVEYFNGEKIEINKMLISQTNQNFTIPLQGKTIFIDNLEVSSLCNLKSDNWLRVNDTNKTNIVDINFNNSSISNDTIFINSEITIKKLNTENIDGINMKHFLNDIFIEGEKQVIKGNITYLSLVQVEKLTANKINNHSSSELVTRYTNQNLSNFFIDTLEVHHLHVENINSIPVDKAARMSQENVIQGKVTLSNFIITDELMVDENIALPLTHSMQVYNEILIDGNVFLKNLEMEPGASLIISDNISNTYNIQNILENSWSKSKNQTIKNSITLKKGASIDKLSCEYLNDLNEKDFLYVNSYEMNDLENITFTNFEFNRVINNNSGIVQRFLEESSDLVTFHKAIRISHLSVDNIFTDSYNGISVQFIMQPNDTLKFLETTDFELVHVDDQMIIDDLHINYLNLQNTNIFDKALRLDQNLEINILKADEIHIKNLKIEKLCEVNLEEALLAQESITNQLKISITIDGDVDIKKNLQVKNINEKSINEYIDILKNINLTDLIETENIKYLYTKNLNVGFLNGHNVNDIFVRALSKSNKQILSEELIVLNINVKYLETEIINKKNVSNLMYTDEPYIFYGNVSFSELFVEGNILTKTLKGKDVAKVQKELHIIPMKTPISLHVFGNIFWNISSSNLYSISHLLNNAVTKHTNQIINCSITFQESIIIKSLYLKTKHSLILNKIQNIISDAVTDNPHIDSIFIKGIKNFKKQLVINDLEVKSNIDINNINNHSFSKISSQIFRKYNNDTVTNQITFLGKVEIGKLVTRSEIHGVPLNKIATYNKRMPKKLHFKHLIITNNITLNKLDGIEMDDFKRKRVTIHKDHEIIGDVQFNAPITVLHETFVSFINGIKPTNLVINNNSKIPNIIYGKKIFMSNLIVERNIEAVKINNFEIGTVYNNSFLNKENVDIFGDLIFEGGVITLSNINVSGQVNKLDIRSILEDEALKKKSIVKYLNEEISIIKNVISSCINLSNKFATDVLYLEDAKLNVKLQGVLSVRSIQIKSMVRLDIHANEFPIFCGLENNCSCRRHYIVKISSLENYTIYQENSFEVTFNFYDPNRSYGLSIVSRAVSTNEHCSQKLNENEISKIFWIKFNNYGEIIIENQVLQVKGFIADAQKFIIHDKLYLILAIFYDKTIKSHATNSLVYEFNLENQKVEFLQSISTDGAKTIHIFQITNIGLYTIIGCVKGRAESLLLRFDSESRRFRILQTFATGGSKHITSVSRHNKNFIILNNPDIEALQIFIYNSHSDNFNTYQNLYFESKITSLNVFYAADFDVGEAFVVTTTKDGWFYVYEYMFFGKFQLKISYWLEDIQLVSPFRFTNQNYIFVASRLNSTVFKVIQSGIH